MQVAKLKEELTLAQRQIANLKNQLHQAKENIAKEECCSKSKKDDSHEDEVGGKRVCQQEKRAKASKLKTSPPSPPRRGFKMLPTGDYDSDSEEEEDYTDQNVRATYAKAKFARIHPISQKQKVQQEIVPNPKRSRAGQFIPRSHQRLIDLVKNSLQDDEDNCVPDLVSDNDDQKSHLILECRMMALSKICTT